MNIKTNWRFLLDRFIHDYGRRHPQRNEEIEFDAELDPNGGRFLVVTLPVEFRIYEHFNLIKAMPMEKEELRIRRWIK